MTYGSFSDDLPVEGRFRLHAARHGLRCGGLAALALSAAFLASLATWRVDDPSLSYPSAGPVQNLLGIPGAIFADLAMQLLGLGALGFVLPVAFFGWALLRLRLPRRAIRQTAAWLFGSVLLSAALACLPVLAEWPLPTGLGGAAGDLMLSIPHWLGGESLSAGLYAALCVFFGGLGIGLLWASCVSRPAVFADSKRRRSARRSRREDYAADEEHEEEQDEEEEEESASEGRLRVVAGILWHCLLAGQTLARRAVAGHKARRDRVRISAPDPAARREPEFGQSSEPDFDDDPEFDEPFADMVQARSTKPAAPASRPSGQQGAARATSPGRTAREPPAPAAASGGYELPPLKLLAEPQQRKRDSGIDHKALEQNARLLEGVLDDFGVRGEIINVRPGPVVTLYELEPAPGIKSSRVIGLADDIARSMSAISARVAVIPGRNVIGIELPNVNRETVYLRELLASPDYASSKGKLALTLGKTIGGEPVIADLAKMPHLLVAGTTGSGKSVSINTMVLSVVYRMTPEQCRLIMIDPKMLELSVYDGIPHLLTPVVTDPRKAVVALKWTVRQMEDRYRKMSKLGVRNIDGFNQRIALAVKKGEVLTRTVQTGFDQETGEPVFETEELQLEAMPFIVVIIDEMADLMMVAGKDIEGAVQRLAQMARAAGIHVIMATQRPSVDVITGTIKANFPTRISFQVTSKIDSRTILGEQGAEQLLGQGDMLYMVGGGRIQRVHGPFVSDQEVENIVAHLKSQGAPDYLESITDEEDEEGGGLEAITGGLEESIDLYDQAVAVVLRDRKVSTSYIQRRLSIGYNRAASIIERMEKEGIVGAANHAGKREILVGQDAA
jgi:S-DNA-T family DNA segregation ATPase FtsK/SpoIIIE